MPDALIREEFRVIAVPREATPPYASHEIDWESDALASEKEARKAAEWVWEPNRGVVQHRYASEWEDVAA